MSEPTIEDMLDVTEDVEQQGNELVNRAAREMALAAYWRGRHEGLELAMAIAERKHDEVLESLIGSQAVILDYLKSRLDRFEGIEDDEVAEAERRMADRDDEAVPFERATAEGMGDE